MLWLLGLEVGQAEPDFSIAQAQLINISRTWARAQSEPNF